MQSPQLVNSGQKTTFLYRTGRGLARFCFANLGRMETRGLDCVPPYGPLIIASNHLSYTDPPVLVASIPRSLHFMAKKELFRDPVSRYAMKGFHVSPLDRSGSGFGAVKLVLQMLAEDKAVVIFPEGHRSPDHTMKEGMLGIAYLALKSQAPILPVGITGTEKIPTWRMPLPLCRFRVSIGQPFTLPVIEGNPGKDIRKGMLDMIMTRISDLLPESYQGVYASQTQAHSPIQEETGAGTPGLN